MGVTHWEMKRRRERGGFWVRVPSKSVVPFVDGAIVRLIPKRTLRWAYYRGAGQ